MASTLSDDTAPSSYAPQSAAGAAWRLAVASGARLRPAQSQGYSTFNHQVLLRGSDEPAIRKLFDDEQDEQLVENAVCPV